MLNLTASQISTLERNAGKKAARTLKSSFKGKANSVFDRLSGEISKTTAKARMKKGRLQRIAIESPYYGFIQQYGFAKKKSNGVYQRLKATYWLGRALEESRALEALADDMAEIRGDEVLAFTKLLENGK